MPLRAAPRAAALAVLLLIATKTASAAPLPTGPEALAEAKRLHTEVATLTEKARYADALPLAQRALAVREAALGPKHPDVAESITDLAEILAHRADYNKAEILHRRALAIRETALGTDHLDVALSLINLGTIHVSKGRYDDAEPLFDRALAIREKKLPRTHKLIAETLADLAAVYYYQARYDKAEPLFDRALAATEAALGKDDPAIARIAANLAALHNKLGRYDAAEPLYRRALAIREKALGPDHPIVATNLSNLGVLLSHRGDFLGARELHERSLAIREKTLGPDHPDVATSLHNLASVHEDTGEFQRAEPLLMRALGILERRLGSAHPTTLVTLQNLSLLLINLGDIRAETYLKRLIEARTKDIEQGDPQAVETMLAIAQMGARIGIYADTRLIAQRALGIIQKTYGEEHPLAAIATGLVASTHAGERDLARAEQLYRRAVEIAEKACGPNHPNLSKFLIHLAAVLADRRDVGRAIDLATRAADIDERNLRVMLGVDSAAQKQRHAATFTSNTERLVELHEAGAPLEPRALKLAFLAILRRKGRAIDDAADSVGALRRRLAPEDASLLDELAKVRGTIAERLLAPSTRPGAIARTDDLNPKAERLETEISRRSAEFREAEAPITLEAVQARVPEGAALVEIFLRHRYARGRALPNRYTAYVLGHRGDPAWIDLGEARPINTSIALLRDALARPTSTDVRARARDLDELVMRPIRRLLGGARRIFFAPDGQLGLVPMSALVDEDGHYLIQGYSITYLTTGRDLLRTPGKGAAATGPVVIANPDFGPVRASSSASPRSRGVADLRGAVFPPLPGTAEEAKALARLLDGPTTKVLTQADASEEALKKLHGPRILHIATHGFFLDDTSTGGVGLPWIDNLATTTPHLSQDDPLLLSGLALAGANQRAGERVGAGILTALEASALDLWGTKLVVLSACETGLGVVEAGEGVSGLRRALLLAGAESAVMSLWKVDDEATRRLMIGMYDRLAKGGGRTEALREAQIEMLGQKDLAHPYYWASFIPSGEYRSLDGAAPAPRFDLVPAGRVTPSARGCGCEAAGSEANEGGGLFALAVAIAAIGRRRRRALG